MNLHWPRPTVRNKLVALSFFFLLAIVMLVFALVQTQQSRLLQGQWQASLHAQARLLATNSQGAVAFLDSREGERLLESLAGNPAIVAGRIVVAGQTWATYRRPGHSDAEFPQSTVDTLFGEDLLFVREAIAPALADPNPAAVEILASLADYHRTMRETRHETGGLLLIALLASLTLTQLVVRRLTEPIERLNRIVAAVSDNAQLDQRVSVAGRDEIAQLGQGFNRMLDNLQARDYELARYRENLEHLVEERTAALQQAIAEAREASRAKSAFLARMSHEIRTPMNAIIGLSRMVLESELAPAEREHVEQIKQSSDALLGILNDILDYSKIEAGRLSLEKTPFRLEQPLHSVRSIFASKAREKGLELRFTTHGTPPVVLGDALRLGQILINLVGNALKFTEEGQIEVSLACQALPTNERVEIEFSVRDTGIGIPLAQQGQLFSPFTQADSSITRRFGGTGLGLAICRQLAELMGGRIEFTSAPGQGSIFTLRVPLTVADAVAVRALEQAEKPGRAGAPLPRWRGERVLLVEDVALNRKIAQALLAKVGLEVVIAVNGQEALDRLEEAPPEAPIRVVLMDIQMPVMDGLTATRRLREDPRHRQLPIIAMTAHAMQEDREESRLAGMDEHLVKPIVPADLYATLARWLPPAAETGA